MLWLFYLEWHCKTCRTLLIHPVSTHRLRNKTLTCFFCKYSIFSLLGFRLFSCLVLVNERHLWGIGQLSAPHRATPVGDLESIALGVVGDFGEADDVREE